MARKVENLNEGSTFYYNRSKCHVVGFCNTFENGETVMLIVYKYWLKYRRYWRYGIVEDWVLQLWFDEQRNHKTIIHKAKKMNTDFIKCAAKLTSL